MSISEEEKKLVVSGIHQKIEFTSNESSQQNVCKARVLGVFLKNW